MINSGEKKQQLPHEATSAPSFVNFVIGGHQKGFPVDRLTLHFVDLLKFSNFSGQTVSRARRSLEVMNFGNLRSLFPSFSLVLFRPLCKLPSFWNRCCFKTFEKKQQQQQQQQQQQPSEARGIFEHPTVWSSRGFGAMEGKASAQPFFPAGIPDKKANILDFQAFAQVWELRKLAVYSGVILWHTYFRRRHHPRDFGQLPRPECAEVAEYLVRLRRLKKGWTS